MGAGFGESIQFVIATGGRMQEDRLWVPRVALEGAGRGMIASDGEHIRFSRE